MSDGVVIREKVIFDGNKGFEYDGKIYRLVVGASPCQTKSGRIFCTWMSGTGGEPEQGHCAMGIYSDDNGSTWSEPFIFVPPAEINGAGSIMTMDGRLYMLKARWPLEKMYTEWQTVIIDTSDYYSGSWPNRCFIENWFSMAFKLASVGSYTLEDAAYVQWVGVFKSPKAARDYAEAFDAKKASSRPAAVKDFTLEATLGNAQLAANVASVYDSYNEAAKFTVADAASADNMRIRLKWYSLASSTEKPVIALRVRLSNADIKFGDFYTSTDVNTSWFSTLKRNPAYEATTEWQTVIIDLTGHNLTGGWTDMHLDLAKAGTITADDAVYVQWAGIFSSATEASLFAANWAESIGDINMDGTVNIRDIIRFKKYLAGSITTCPTFEQADFDSDKSISSGDIVGLRKMLLGLLDAE